MPTVDCEDEGPVTVGGRLGEHNSGLPCLLWVDITVASGGRGRRIRSDLGFLATGFEGDGSTAKVYYQP